MMKALSFLLLCPLIALSQPEAEHKGIHQNEAEIHRHDPIGTIGSPEAPVPLMEKPGGRTVLEKKVYGWYPYWASGSAYLAYDYTTLSHIAHFSYETDTATGGYTTIRGWDTTPIISYAHQRGVKVTLTVTNFGNTENDKLLSDTVKQERMISTLISLLKSRNGDGVNFDLESVRSTQRANLVSFMRRATTRIKAELPNAEISMATPAVDWSGAWDFAQLAQICDYLIVMGYAYYWNGSSTAGPVAPLEGENYTVTRTIDTYVANGVPRQKLLLGVPWYGIDWPVTSGARKATTTGSGSSRTYVIAEPLAASYGKMFDGATKVPWFVYMVGSAWRQAWYDDSLSLALKYNLVNSKALDGIGIWALSYDGGRPELWNGMKAAFVRTDVETMAEVPQQPQLMQNFPNPFNAATVIKYTVGGTRGQGSGVRDQGSGASVSLRVYDLLGREIMTLVNERKEAGTYQVTFDAPGLASGVYVYVLDVGSFRAAKTMLLVR